jgi:uncharacterized protein (TIGR02757 family)
VSAPDAGRLRAALESLEATTEPRTRLAADPLGFVHRYDDPADQEVAAVFASGLAYGRVAGFRPTIQAVLDHADGRGGPRAWLRTLDAADDDALAQLNHRWTRGTDLARMAHALARVLDEWGRLGAVAEAADDPDSPTLAPALEAVVQALRQAAVTQAAEPFAALPRGFRYLLPAPSGGSACKRWCMLLRWMVRPPGVGASGVDLGIWDLDPARLVMPLDTHVRRLAWFTGLTDRRDASWRTAVAITQALRTLDPDDPLRHDFALAHLGISGACRSQFVRDICGACSLAPICRVARGARSAR